MAAPTPPPAALAASPTRAVLVEAENVFVRVLCDAALDALRGAFGRA
eukprot:CAMPEP_0198345598 /NCGR_PEP_ID=MMETSP1450-20131203/75086_1 /TAXON_ID=753684 ORGANISM="Madagascaria erythrocladiodes, Strain CCMP3234" /NCGR_SAMPLE_ID=MMETSP1450 /ASSEMBLY_ACC=CAM_ASM_001115 /LENGTH=46 /DNA_ID= /DNA_START= /DNA_END= /DNA_ORIENTATION=